MNLLRPGVFPHTWNNRVVEYWNIDFNKQVFILDISTLIVKKRMSNDPKSHFPEPTFHLLQEK